MIAPLGVCLLVALACSSKNAADCAGVTVDLNTDHANCGACGKRCSPAEACTAGSCACKVFCGTCQNQFISC